MSALVDGRKLTLETSCCRERVKSHELALF